MSDKKQRIYVYALPAPQWDGVVAYALSEDGKVLASHISSNDDFAQHDMGLTSDWKHDIYDAKYPDGYELEWIGRSDLDDHEGFQRAYRLNQEYGK